jgi:S-adenosylmethionine synthetase
LVTTGLVVCAGEVRTNSYIDIQRVARNVIEQIGYTKGEYMFESNSCGVISAIHEQSPDIYQGVDREDIENQGAGDQGMMFGYAVKEMDNLMPLPIELAHIFMQELAAIRKEGKKMKYLRPDSKSQITVEYNAKGVPVKINTIIISTQHDEFVKADNQSKKAQDAADTKMLETIKTDVEKVLIPRVKSVCPPHIRRLFKGDYNLYVNPTGKFVIGGPHGDTGLTGRKIIVDTYGGKGAHGGGAFSGKDSSKVDRSAAYAARHIAKNIVAAGIAKEVLVQVAYAIGIANPVGIFVNTYNTCLIKDKIGKKISDDVIAEKVKEIFDLRPYAIIKRFGLQNPIFQPTATYGHFGRDCYKKEVEVFYKDEHTKTKKIDGEERYFKEVEFFAWEKLDYVDKLKKAFDL